MIYTDAQYIAKREYKNAAIGSAVHLTHFSQPWRSLSACCSQVLAHLHKHSRRWCSTVRTCCDVIFFFFHLRHQQKLHLCARKTSLVFLQLGKKWFPQYCFCCSSFVFSNSSQTESFSSLPRVWFTIYLYTWSLSFSFRREVVEELCMKAKCMSIFACVDHFPVFLIWVHLSVEISNQLRWRVTSSLVEERQSMSTGLRSDR